MTRNYLLLTVLFYSSLVFCQFPNEIVLTDENLGESAGHNVGVLKDVDGIYETYNDIASVDKNEFIKADVEIPDFNFTAARYWLRFSLTNNTDFTHFIFETGRTVTNKVEFFELVGEEVAQHYISGDDFKYSDKKIIHRKNLFPIELDKGETKTFYLKLESDGELLFAPIIIHDRMSFFAQDFKDQFKNGFYYGLIALVVIIYFFFFVFLRDRAFLFYILYAFSQGALQFSLDGYTHHHFFPNGGYFTNHVLLFFAGLTVIFLLTYVNNFLNLKKHNPLMWKTFLVSRIALAGIIVMSLIPGALYELSYPIINGASLFGVLLAAYCIIRLRVKGIEVDFFFALAFIILIIGGVVFILGNLSIVGDKIISLGALKVSSALEFVILSISMSNKYGKLQREKEEAQQLALKNLQEKNELMDQSNIILERQVKERTSEIEMQREKLAVINEEIVSSIKYAKRIQEAILPSKDHVNALIPDSFVFYRPKDVVSGDFYFVETASTNIEYGGDHYIIFAAVDCTGHGVPGAFMSIVGNNLLRQSLTEKEVNSPGEALDFLNAGVNETLRISEGATVQDGMDIAMCAVNIKQNKLLFAGAKNPLYLIRKDVESVKNDPELTGLIVEETENLVMLQIRGDRHPIGNAYDDGELKPFTTHTLDLKAGDEIFVFTDGYADQFGGSKRKRLKKFNYRRFRELLLSVYGQPADEQKKVLKNEFEKWMGTNPQIDDVLVIGVKF